MSENSFELTPFTDEEPVFINPPVLPDVVNREPLGSGIVTRILGQGGMANVYEIWVPQLEVFRAVKIIKPESSKDAKGRFQTEIRILAKLTHPNIVDIHNVGDWKGMPYIEMEKIDGVTLDQVIRQRGALAPEICTAIGILVCRALAFAHAHEYVIYGKTYTGIIHRDLKPGNIMICQNGILKLMDFGIARPADASFHTIDGAIVGTIQYMSPELLNGESIDIRTDIYALGSTLYEILAGINSFPEPNFSKLVTLKQKNQFRPLNEFKIKMPSKLRKLIHKCMQEDRRRRFTSTEKLLFELDKIHRQITRELPEVILREFYAEGPGEKCIPVVGRIIPWKTIVGIPVLILAFGAVLYLGAIYIKNRSADESQPVPVLEATKVESVASPPDKPVAHPDEEVKTDKKQPEAKPSIQPKRQKAVITKPDPEPEGIVLVQEEKPEQPKQLSLIERLKKQHGTSDVMNLIEREYGAGRLTTALALYDYLPPKEAGKNRAKIYKMRILQQLGRKIDLGKFLSNNYINDSEFILAQAQFAYRRNEITKARLLLEKSLNAPKQFSDYNSIKQQVYHYKALCASKIFYHVPVEQNYLKALEEWRNLGALFSNNKNHKLFLEYRMETRKIGEKYRAVQ